MSETIRYVDTPEGIDAEQLDGFFDGWPNPPDRETHLRILRSSSLVCLALDTEVDTGVDKVVGFVTAISDGVMAAYLPLLEVLPAYRGRGIGRRLTRRMLDRLSHFYMVDLQCDRELRPFYESVGMKPASGMRIRHYENQGGTR